MKKYFLNAEVNQINMFSERWYKINAEGVEYVLPSVTTYLSAFPKGIGYEKWLMDNKDPYSLRDEAAVIGSATHDMIERTLKGETIEFVEGQTTIESWEKYLGWCKFYKDFVKDPASALWTKTEIAKSKIVIKELVMPKDFIEFVTFDLEAQYAGTVDALVKLVYEDKVEYAIVDWKTGKHVGDTAYLQTAAYAKSVSKLIGYPVTRTIIVQLGLNLNKDGYKTYTHAGQDLENDFIDFNHTKAVWLRENKNEKPKFKIYPMAVNLDFIKNNEIVLG